MNSEPVRRELPGKKQKQTEKEQIYEKLENDFRVGGIGAAVSPRLWLCARKL